MAIVAHFYWSGQSNGDQVEFIGNGYNLSVTKSADTRLLSSGSSNLLPKPGLQSCWSSICMESLPGLFAWIQEVVKYLEEIRPIKP